MLQKTWRDKAHKILSLISYSKFIPQTQSKVGRDNKINKYFNFLYFITQYGYSPHEMASLTKWPILCIYLKLIFSTKLGGFVVTIWKRSLLAILPIQGSLARATLSWINLTVYVEIFNTKNTSSTFLDQVLILKLHRRYSMTVDHNRLVSTWKKYNLANEAEKKAKRDTCLTKWP